MKVLIESKVLALNVVVVEAGIVFVIAMKYQENKRV